MVRWGCVYVLVFVSASAVHAQSGQGTLRGSVTDPQGQAMVGVTLVLESATAPPARTTTDDRGRYRVDLAPGTYTLTITQPGFADVRQEIVVRAGLNAELRLQLTLGALAESVDVVHEAPLLETLRGGHAVNVSGELLRGMPLLERREWFGALTLVPGVTTSEAGNQRQFYVHGADSGANVVQIDGADMTPTGGGGVRFVGLNTDAVEDIQIKTAGVDASAPLGLGGIINIAAASGSNTVKGSATVFAQPRAWNASNTPGGTSSTTAQQQVDLSMGVPIVKDRLWAFAAYRYFNHETGLSRTPEQLAAFTALVPGFQPFDNTSRAHLWFTKLTAQLSPSHQVSGFYQHDDSPATAPADGASARASTRSSGGLGASVRLYSTWSNRWTTRFGASVNDKGQRGRDAGVNEPLQRVFQSARLSGGRLAGTSRLIDRGAPQTAWSEQHNSRTTIWADTTLFLADAAGSHEVQTGVYAQPRIRNGLQDYYPNGGFIYENATLRQPGVIESGVIPFYRLVYEETSLTRSRRLGQDYAVYVQDAWRPHPRLTINAGVRVDWISWRDRLFDVRAQASTEVGPRFSVNYALTAEARDVAKAHWVRVHDQPTATSTSVGTVAVGQRELYDLDLDGTFETVFVRPGTKAVTQGRTIDTGFHQPFVQEWGFGYEKQFPGALTVGVDLLRRDFRDRPTLLERNRRYDGRVFTGFLDEAFSEIYQATNNQWNWPVYTSLEVSMSKRTARLQGLASYVRQWRHLAGTWQPDDPASLLQPTAFANNKAIGSATGSTAAASQADSLSGSNMTPGQTGSSQWQDHIVRLGASWRGPWALILATNYTFQSGTWSGPIVDILAAADPAFGPSIVTLSDGRRVPNPLATAIRFAYPTRGDGQLRSPALHVWNLRVGRRLTLGRLQLDASFDVFNATNNDSDASFESGANQRFAENFGTTQFRQSPRSGQIAMRASF